MNLYINCQPTISALISGKTGRKWQLPSFVYRRIGQSRRPSAPMKARIVANSRIIFQVSSVRKQYLGRRRLSVLGNQILPIPGRCGPLLRFACMKLGKVLRVGYHSSTSLLSAVEEMVLFTEKVLSACLGLPGKVLDRRMGCRKLPLSLVRLPCQPRSRCRTVGS